MQSISRTLIAFSLAALATTPLHAGPIKCWTNSEGVRECGNAIPPEYAQEESRSVSTTGVTTEVQQRAKTPAERAAEEQRRQAEEARLAEEKRKQEEQLKRDQVLLGTFASEQDIVMARDRKISSLEGTIELTNVSIGKQKQKVDDFRKRVADMERAGKPVPQVMMDDMAVEQEKLDNKIAFVAAKRAEVEALRKEYEGYLIRFRELAQRNGR